MSVEEAPIIICTKNSTWNGFWLFTFFQLKIGSFESLYILSIYTRKKRPGNFKNWSIEICQRFYNFWIRRYEQDKWKIFICHFRGNGISFGYLRLISSLVHSFFFYKNNFIRTSSLRFSKILRTIHMLKSPYFCICS